MPIRVLALLLLLTVSVPAAAQRSVTVIGVDGGPVGSETVLTISSGMLIGAEDARGNDVVDYTNVTLDDVVQLVGCSGVELRCLNELAATLETDLLVFGAFPDPDEPDFDLTFFDAGSDEIPGAFSLVIPEDGVHEFIAARVQAFLDGNAHVTISAGAEGQILVDGRAEGPAPLTITTLDPGTYEFTLELADGRTSSIDAEIDSVGVYEFEIRAPRGRAPAADDGAPSRPIRPARVAGWTSVALGVGAFAVATYHGTEVANAQQRFDATPYQSEAYAIANDGRRSARASNTFIAIGAGLTAVGVLALILDRPPQEDEAAAPTWAVAPAEGGALGVVRWTR